jgi:hypothetical protein
MCVLMPVSPQFVALARQAGAHAPHQPEDALRDRVRVAADAVGNLLQRQSLEIPQLEHGPLAVGQAVAAGRDRVPRRGAFARIGGLDVHGLGRGAGQRRHPAPAFGQVADLPCQPTGEAGLDAFGERRQLAQDPHHEFLVQFEQRLGAADAEPERDHPHQRRVVIEQFEAGLGVAVAPAVQQGPVALQRGRGRGHDRLGAGRIGRHHAQGRGRGTSEPVLHAAHEPGRSRGLTSAARNPGRLTASPAAGTTTASPPPARP